MEFVLSVLPHRPPMLLVDRISSCIPGKSIHAQRTFYPDEPWFQGHFPNNPILPGVLVLEAMAQAGGFLFIGTDDQPRMIGGVVIGFHEVKFKHFVKPGDTLNLHGTLVVRMGVLARAEFKADITQHLVASAQVSYILEVP